MLADAHAHAPGVKHCVALSPLSDCLRTHDADVHPSAGVDEHSSGVHSAALHLHHAGV